jgi:hypothetical protein
LLQRKHSDGQRRHACLLGRTRGTPGSTQIPRARGRRFAVRPSQRRYGTRTCRRPNGMSQLFEMDGEYDVLPLILDYDSPTKAPRPNDTII